MWLIDTGIGRIEVFCEHPVTCTPDIPKQTKEKAAPFRRGNGDIFEVVAGIRRHCGFLYCTRSPKQKKKK